jgi:hypothetical protein
VIDVDELNAALHVATAGGNVSDVLKAYELDSDEFIDWVEGVATRMEKNGREAYGDAMDKRLAQVMLATGIVTGIALERGRSVR